MVFRDSFQFFGLLLLLFSLEICLATKRNDCPPSSCGTIEKISFPLRLKSDPENCGHPGYELVCENNRTVIYLSSKRFFVLSITYENSTIRLVDPRLENYQGYSSSCPINYLTYDDFTELYTVPPYTTTMINNFLVFISCSSQISEAAHYNKSTFCGDNNNKSIQQNYSYVIIGKAPRLGDIRDSCSVKKVAWVSSNAPLVGNTQFVDYSYGFEIPWAFSEIYCGSCDNGEFFSDGNGTVYCEKSCSLWKPSTITKVKCLKKFTQDVLDFCYRNSRYPEIALGARYFLGILCLFALIVYKIRRKHLSEYESIEDFLQGQNNLVPIRYTYAEVIKMTHNFRDKLGEGGYGTVFKGKLRSGSLVAIKMIAVKSKSSGEEFISEVATIGRIHHVNVVNLIGFCFRGSKRALVYEFMPNGSLEKYIFVPKDGETKLTASWEKMFKISLGIARGMDYLHRGCEMQILHFDIKPHNILLDENFNPKISDFGLAKLYPADDSIVSLTAARGTMGYMAPELFYKNIGRVSYKADVYSFGMLLMEMAGKRKNLNPFVDHLSQIYFPSWVHDQFSQGKEIEIEDSTEDEKKIVKKMILVALWCIQMKPIDRPSMNKVVEMLECDLELLEIPPKPFLSPEGMDHKDHDQDLEINKNNVEFPLLSTSHGDSRSLEIEFSVEIKARWRTYFDRLFNGSQIHYIRDLLICYLIEVKFIILETFLSIWER